MTRFLFVTATAFLVVPAIIVSTVIAEAQLWKGKGSDL